MKLTTIRIAESLGALGVVALTACSGGGGHGGQQGGGGSPTNYIGTLAGPSGAGGTLTVAIASPSAEQSVAARMVAPAAAQAASGTLVLPACQESLQGSFDGTNLTLHGTGACGTFDLNGALDTGIIYGGADGQGIHWIFTIVAEVNGISLTTYCGTWTETTNGVPDGAAGTWNLIIDGEQISGVSYDDQNQPFRFGGYVTNGTEIFLGHQGQQIGSGTISGGDASGTYTIGMTQGTWQAHACQ